MTVWETSQATEAFSGRHRGEALLGAGHAFGEFFEGGNDVLFNRADDFPNEIDNRRDDEDDQEECCPPGQKPGRNDKGRGNKSRNQEEFHTPENKGYLANAK